MSQSAVTDTMSEHAVTDMVSEHVVTDSVITCCVMIACRMILIVLTVYKWMLSSDGFSYSISVDHLIHCSMNQLNTHEFNRF